MSFLKREAIGANLSAASLQHLRRVEVLRKAATCKGDKMRMRRELPLTSEEQKSIAQLHGKGWGADQIAIALVLRKRQVRYEIDHGRKRREDYAESLARR